MLLFHLCFSLLYLSAFLLYSLLLFTFTFFLFDSILDPSVLLCSDPLDVDHGHWSLPRPHQPLFTEVLTDFCTFGRDATPKNNVKPVQSSQSSQSSQSKTLSRIGGSPFALNPANQILSSSLPFVLGLCILLATKQKTSDGHSLRYTDGPLGVLNDLHLSPVSPTPAPAAAIFLLCVSVQNPISGKQHVVIGYSFCWTLACVTRILRNFSFDPRDISFALAHNNSLLHRRAFPA